MAKYLQILCSRCKHPIGTARHVKYTDVENNLVYFYHAQTTNDCWTKTQQEAQTEFWLAVCKAKRRRYAT